MDMNRRTLLGFTLAVAVVPSVGFAAVEEGPAVFRKLPKEDWGKQSKRIFTPQVHVPTVPAGSEAFSFSCSIFLTPTAEVQAWADRTGGSVSFGFEEVTNEIMMTFPSMKSANLFEAEFGPLRESEGDFNQGEFADRCTAKPRTV